MISFFLAAAFIASGAQACGDGARRPDGGAAPSSDLYCVHLAARPGLEGISGRVELKPWPTPFGVAVDASGRLRYEGELSLEGLPEDPRELGPYDHYVAWLTTPLFEQVVNLGAVENGVRSIGEITLNKFMFVITAEAEPDGEEWAGRLLLRATSPSARMSPPDMQEYLLGEIGADKMAGGHGHGGHGEGGGWPMPWMPPNLAMFPALMTLDPPNARPFRAAAGIQVDALPLARPRETIVAKDGDRIRLEAGLVRRTLRGREHVLYAFNGQIPGPLLRVPEAARVTVDFVNRVPWSTTVHWHGLRLDNASDGVPGITQDPVAPGESFQYELYFKDPGIYWYHPHHREDLLKELGLYGNMLVEPAKPDYYGPADREEAITLDDFLVAAEGDPMPFGEERASHALMGRFGNVMLLNGEPDYVLEATAGEVLRLHLTNVSNTRTFNVSFPGARAKVVGADIGALEREEWVESLVIAPAERYVVHARYPNPGRTPILNRVQGIDHLAGRFFSEVDTMGFVDVQAAGDPPERSPAAQTFGELRVNRQVEREISLYRDEFDRPVDKELVFTLRADGLPFVVDRIMRFDSAYFHPVEFSPAMPMMNWNSTSAEVEWVLREPSTGLENMEIDWQFEVGEVVKIRLRNERRALHAMQHPFHIHGQRFLVLARNGVPVENLGWKDTALLPVGTTTDILLEVTNPGDWMAHCHISEHLEAGMRTVFRVTQGLEDRRDLP